MAFTELTKLCACGCNQNVRSDRRYKKNHSPKVADLQTCVCGCGQLTNAGKKYVHGHNNPPKTEEGLEKLRQSKVGNTFGKKNRKYIKLMQLCLCDCGELTRPGYRFIAGHQRTGKPARNKGLNPKPEAQLCQCSCGQYAKPGDHYIHGHNRRKEPKQLNLCKCGCGTLVKHSYVIGHYNIGRKRSAEQCEKHRQWMLDNPDKTNPKRHKCIYKNGEVSITMRSTWEVKYAYYLDSVGYSWLYEPEWFETSVGFYLPDFFLPDLKQYHEVKGFHKEKGILKMEAFKNEYPQEEIVLIDETKMKKLRLL